MCTFQEAQKARRCREVMSPYRVKVQGRDAGRKSTRAKALPNEEAGMNSSFTALANVCVQTEWCASSFFSSSLLPAASSWE